MAYVSIQRQKGLGAQIGEGLANAADIYYDEKNKQRERDLRAAALEYERQKNADAIAREQANRAEDKSMSLIKMKLDAGEPLNQDEQKTAGLGGVSSLTTQGGYVSPKQIEKKQKEKQDNEARKIDMEYKQLQINQLKNKPPEQTPTEKENQEIGKSAKLQDQKNAMFINKAERAESDLQTSMLKYDPTGRFEQMPVWERLKSGERKAFEQAGKSFVQAVLRPESGAAIPETELQSYMQILFPMPGDNAQVLMQKKAQRAAALETLKSGGTYRIGENKPQQATGLTPEQQARKAELLKKAGK